MLFLKVRPHLQGGCKINPWNKVLKYITLAFEIDYLISECIILDNFIKLIMRMSGKDKMMAMVKKIFIKKDKDTDLIFKREGFYEQ